MCREQSKQCHAYIYAWCEVIIQLILIVIMLIIHIKNMNVCTLDHILDAENPEGNESPSSYST